MEFTKEFISESVRLATSCASWILVLRECSRTEYGEILRISPYSAEC